VVWPMAPKPYLSVVSGTVVACVVTLAAQDPATTATRERLSGYVNKLFALAYRSDVDGSPGDAKLEIVLHVDAIEDLVTDSCSTEQAARDCYDIFPIDHEDVTHFLSLLRTQAYHGDSAELLVTTLRQFGSLTGFDLAEVPPPIQRRRTTRVSIASVVGVTEAQLEKQHASYEQRIRGASLDVGSSIHFNMDLIPLPRQPDSEGVRYQVRSGPPMFSEQELSTFQAVDSSRPADDTLPLDETGDPRGSYRLAPAEDVARSSPILHYAWELAESGVLFSCDPDDEAQRCYFLAASGTPDSTSFQLSLCEVTGNVESDPPTRCTPFVIKTETGLWIAVLDTFTHPEEGGGVLDSPIAEVTLRVYVDDRKLDVAPLLVRTLAESPLLLDVHVRAASVRGTSPQRPSEILSTRLDRWNEWLMIIAEHEQCADEGTPRQWSKLHQLCVSFTISVLVNKQKNPERGSWHPAESHLSARLVTQLKAAVRRVLESSCKRHEVFGDRLACFSS
jgi:hypothetical protein